jgi:hypothetical protein
MSLMSTYGTTSPKEGQKETQRHYKNGHGQIVTTTFQYLDVIANHYSYCGCVDDHNNKRQDGEKKQGLSLESTWVTYRWPVCEFSFILGITEVNAYLAWQYFMGTKLKFLDFWKRLAHALIYNRLFESDRVHNDGRQGQKRRQVDHTLVRALLYARQWTGNEWGTSRQNTGTNSIFA